MRTKVVWMITGIVAVIAVISLAFLFLSDNKISNKLSPISIITYSSDNSSVIITKHNFGKTADVKMEIFMNEADLKNKFMDLTNFTTNMGCGIMQMAFFNQTAFDKFNEEINKWNQMNGTVQDEKNKTIGKPEGNPLEGYKVTNVNFYLKDKSTKVVLSECTITGPSRDDIRIDIK